MQLLGFGLSGDDSREYIGYVCQRVDAIELGGLDQGEGDSPVLGCGVGAGEQGVLAAQCNGAHGAFDGVGVDLEAAIVEEQPQARPMVQGVADGLGEGGGTG